MPMTIQELEDQKVREGRLKAEAAREAVTQEREAIAAGLQTLANEIRHDEREPDARNYADAIEVFIRKTGLATSPGTNHG